MTTRRTMLKTGAAAAVALSAGATGLLAQTSPSALADETTPSTVPDAMALRAALAAAFRPS